MSKHLTKGRTMVMVCGRITAPTTLITNCIICHEPLEAERATAGSLYADGRQAFACTAHLRHAHQWLEAWIRFEQNQQRIRELDGRVQ